MLISIYGETDKRPVIYTLMKMFQTLGDTWLVSDNRHYKRLISDRALEGSYQNILISIADTTEDEVYADLEHIDDDFDYIIFDNIISTKADLIIYVKGEKESDEEKFALSSVENYKTIELGFGKKPIKYSVNMFKNIEHVEATNTLVEIDPVITSTLAKMLSPVLKLSESKLRKVVQRK